MHTVSFSLHMLFGAGLLRGSCPCPRKLPPTSRCHPAQGCLQALQLPRPPATRCRKLPPQPHSWALPRWCPCPAQPAQAQQSRAPMASRSLAPCLQPQSSTRMWQQKISQERSVRDARCSKSVSAPVPPFNMLQSLSCGCAGPISTTWCLPRRQGPW